MKIHTRFEDPSKEQKFFPASLAMAKEMLSLQGVFPKKPSWIQAVNKGFLGTEFSVLQTRPFNTKHLHSTQHSYVVSSLQYPGGQL